jgi:hypothetical protein
MYNVPTASLQLLLDGNPLHEFTTSSMAKREEMKKQHAALSAIAKGSSAGDSLATSGEKKAKVYTIGLLSDSGAVKPAAASGSLGLLGYSRSVRASPPTCETRCNRCSPQHTRHNTHDTQAKCTAIQTLRGYFTEGIDEDDVPETEEEDKENDDPNTDDSEAEEWEEERRGEEELTYLGIKEHLAFLDYNNYFINTGISPQSITRSLNHLQSTTDRTVHAPSHHSAHERHRHGQDPGAGLQQHRKDPAAGHLLVPCSRYAPLPLSCCGGASALTEMNFFQT